MFYNTKDVLSSIVSPLNEKVIQEVVYLYSKYNMNLSESFLVNTKIENGYAPFKKKNYDDFVVYQFNLWRNSIISLSYEEIEQLINKGIIDRDFLQLVNYLNYINDALNTKEVEIITKPGQHFLEEMIEKYKCPSLSISSKNKISSNLFYNNSAHFKDRTEYLFQFKDICEYMIIINPTEYDTLKLCRLFQDMCVKQKLPYLYEYNTDKEFNNKIKIYSDKDNLPKYLNILEELKKKNKNLFNRCNRPPVVCGVINDKYGITSSDHSTFVSLGNQLEKCISDTLNTCVKDNMNSKISKDFSLLDYVSSNISLKIINNMTVNNSNSECLEKYSYSKEEIKSIQFYNAIISSTKKQLTNFYKNFPNKNIFDDYEFNININGKKQTLIINKNYVRSCMIDMTYDIFELFPNYYNLLLKYIKDTLRTKGLDSKYYLNNSISNYNKQNITK